MWKHMLQLLYKLSCEVIWWSGIWHWVVTMQVLCRRSHEKVLHRRITDEQSKVRASGNYFVSIAVWIFDSYPCQYTIYIVFASDIVTCQSMARSYLAFQTFGLLNYKRNMARGRSNMVNIKRCAMILHAIRCLLKATLIQKAVRGWIVRRQYKKDIKGNKQMLKSFRCLDGHSNLCFVFFF